MSYKKDGTPKNSASYMSFNTSNLSPSTCETRNATSLSSLSICENRNLSSLSPFYSARTMYGGASSLLPYSNQTPGRMRSASTSKLNVFLPRSQITIQPVPSLSKAANDQETMSAAARRILDTLEKYCSPVTDAKRIPVNESSRKAIESDSPIAGPSRGVKRKLPALCQLMPSTTELLRIKRREKMQDSVSNARQIVSTVPESSFVAGDSDTSSDSADLDYSVLKKDTIKTASRQKYIGRIRRKDEKELDDRPLAPIQLPNAVLKITNLPKFDITDTFTFSKPLLLEHFEQSVLEETVNDHAARDDLKSVTTKSVSSSTATAQKSPKSSSTNVGKSSAKPAPASSTPSWNFASGLSPSSQLFVPNSSATPSTSPKPGVKKRMAPWSCSACHLENVSQTCSSCTAEPPPPKQTPAKPETVTKPTFLANTGEATSKPPSPTPATAKMTTIGSPTMATATVTNGPSTPTSAEEPWKKLQKPAISSWKRDEFGTQNQLPSQPSGGNSISAGFTAADNANGFVSKKTTVDSQLVTCSGGFSSPTPTFSFGSNNLSAVAVTTAVSTTTSQQSPASGLLFNGPKLDGGNELQNYKFGGNTNVTSAAASTNSSNIFSNAVVSSTQFNFNTHTSPSIPNTDEQQQQERPAMNSMFPSAAAKVQQQELPPMNAIGSNSTSVFGNNVFATASAQPATTDPIKKSGGFNFPATTNQFIASSVNSFSNFASPAADDQDRNRVNNCAESTTAKPDAVAKPTLFAAGENDTFKLPSPMTTTTVGSPKPTTAAIMNGTVTPAGADDPWKKLQKIATSSWNQLPSQANSGNSIFGGFAVAADGFSLKKTTVVGSSPLVTSSGGFANATPTFSFGSNNLSVAAVTTATVTTTSQQLPVGGLAFNGPKAERGNGSQNYEFGSNATSTVNANSCNVFGNAVAPSTHFNFNTHSAVSIPNASETQQRLPMNSIFPPTTMKVQQQQQLELPQTNTISNNSTTVFGNNMFAAASAQPATTNPIKKSGGFNFPATTNQFIAPGVNSFSSFVSPAADNQDQNRVNSGMTPASTPFVFGAQNQNAQPHNFNLTVPTTFNFTGGNTLPSFSAQPTPGSTGTPAVVQRRIKKAVRRTVK